MVGTLSEEELGKKICAHILQVGWELLLLLLQWCRVTSDIGSYGGHAQRGGAGQEDLRTHPAGGVGGDCYCYNGVMSLVTLVHLVGMLSEEELGKKIYAHILQVGGGTMQVVSWEHNCVA
jgi:hypothetical protein